MTRLGVRGGNIPCQSTMAHGPLRLTASKSLSLTLF